MTVHHDALSNSVRTRFAPSPTGFMHVGNLRTALYEYLIAKSKGGTFILRIEDTDQERLVPGAVDIIYRTLRTAGLTHDEGPDIGGPYGPYVQSERMHLYRPFAEQLVQTGKAYYCFCTRERLDALRSHADSPDTSGYDRHCRDLPAEAIRTLLDSGAPYVIRQKMPLSGTTTFSDQVFGDITVPNKELEDQILLKTDGFPTYNFANIIDDHLMQITHVVRGSEYLSSAPKYNLLYEAFGFDIPTYVHLPLIQGRGEDGSVSKLSKRHGATGFEDLVREGYLVDAIINYIALLGWCPKEDTREIFSLSELTEVFSIDGISKSPAIFDYDKLEWFNGEYIRAMSQEQFLAHARVAYESLLPGTPEVYDILTGILQPRITRFSQITEKLAFLRDLPPYDLELFVHTKSKTTLENSLSMLTICEKELAQLGAWNHETISDCLISLAVRLGVKNAQVMWPIRISITGTAVTPGGAVEMLLLLGKEESLRRMENGRQRLST
jgi:glutamyl-tRNA synthetase